MGIFSEIGLRFLQRRVGEKSTAGYLADRLTSKGIEKKQIESKHIRHVYRVMKDWKDRPINTTTIQISNSGNKFIARKLLGVIIETRAHPALEYVVGNFIRELGIPVQLYHGKCNKDYILSTHISELARQGNVILTQLEADSLTATKYNELLMSDKFWASLVGRKKILMFQTDTIVCSKTRYSIDDFISYDYIGSNWPRHRPIGLTIDGGNGGFSLRDWEKSYECIQRFPPSFWKGGEDSYFSFHLDLMGAHVGRSLACSRFCTQYEFSHKSLGAHKVSCLTMKELARFLDYCPEAKFMVSTEAMKKIGRYSQPV
ncbi:MAG TPA: DUF5672 family protein [Nitrococcus sp.]|nr:DUF5672 family protein [Nitrococcus sp.]